MKHVKESMNQNNLNIAADMGNIQFAEKMKDAFKLGSKMVNDIIDIKSDISGLQTSQGDIASKLETLENITKTLIKFIINIYALTLQTLLAK